MPTGQQYSSVSSQATLVGAITSGATSMVVSSTSGFPGATPYTLVLDIGTQSQEIVDVTSVSGTTLTITRAVDSSSAISHANGATVTHSHIARDDRESRAHIDASTSNDSTGKAVHGLTSGSSVVGTTDTQTLTNKTLTSPTVNTPTITNPTITGGGTWTGSPSLTSPTLSGPTIGGTVAGGGTYLEVIDQNINTANVPLTVNSIAGSTGDAFDVKQNGTLVHAVSSLSSSSTPLSAFGPTADQVAVRVVRGTDSSPAQNLMEFWNHAINSRLAYVDPNGVYNGPQAAGCVQLASTTLAATAGSVTFSSISQSYTNLMLVFQAQDNGAAPGGNVALTFNGLSASNYTFITWDGTQSTPTPAGTTTTSATSWSAAGRSGSNGATGGAADNVITINNYSGSTFRKGFVSQTSQADGSGANFRIHYAAGAYVGSASTAAITSLTLTSANTFQIGSKFTLYGML